MGSATSNLQRRRQSTNRTVRLSTSRLRFSEEHLTQVTARIMRLEAESAETASDLASRRAQSAIEGAVERLVQRLVAGVGSLDHRFASKYLVRLPTELRHQEPAGKYFAYLVRIDALSSPPLYSEKNASEPVICLTEAAPAGCARLRLNSNRDFDLWKEFLTDDALLRRDKIQEQFVKLLARSASLSSDAINDKDSLLCLSPGKILDAGLLYRLLQTPPETQVFYGPVNSGITTDPRNFRLAIVEGAGEVRLRVGLLSPTLEGLCGDIDIELVLGIGLNIWPSASDFPARVPLYHPDALMYYQLMNTGCYAVAGAPPLAMRRGGVGERGTLWRLSPLAAEADLCARWPPYSLPARIQRACIALVEQLAGRCTRADLGGLGLPPLPLQTGCRVITPAHVSTLVWFNTETCSNPLDATWACNQSLGVRVLYVLDTLCQQLRNGKIRSYWFPDVNLLDATGWPSEAWEQDASTLESLLRSLHADTRPGVLQPLAPLTTSAEEALLTRWRDIVDAMAPPRVPRNSKPTGHYSPQQLQYISQLLHAMLRSQRPRNSGNITLKDLPEHIKDLIQITRHLLEQICIGAPPQTRSSADAFLLKIKEDSALHPSVSALQDDAALVGHAFALLHIAADTDKILCSAIRPWLSRVSLAAHESTLHNGWMNRRRDELERESAALSLLTRSLNSCGNNCSSGLAARFAIDAAAKGWLWARDLIATANMMTEPLTLVLTPGSHKDRKFSIEWSHSKKQIDYMEARSAKSLPRSSNINSIQSEKLNKFRTLGPSTGRLLQTNSHSSVYDNSHPVDELTLRLQRWFYSLPNEPNFSISAHIRLRDASPLTLLTKAARISHMYSGMGDVIQALVSMQRFSVLQEIATLLPDAEQAQALDVIRRLAREARRQHRRPTVQLPNNKSSNNQKQIVELPSSPQGTYKPSLVASSLLNSQSQENDPQRQRMLQREKALAAEVIKMRRAKETLLAACREARRNTTTPLPGIISHRFNPFAPTV